MSDSTDSANYFGVYLNPYEYVMGAQGVEPGLDTAVYANFTNQGLDKKGKINLTLVVFAVTGSCPSGWTAQGAIVSGSPR